ncbi:MAG TPA: MarR family transcriptional regulator [Mycobacteriales bacterium]|nr:MarR family transcriptional regulator [Mycobacteriales bacterium]
MSTDTGQGANGLPRGRVGRVSLARQLQVWRSFLRSHAAMMRRLERDLVDEHGLPLAWYDVLVQLAEAPERRLRMTELADRVLLSRSGLTRLVDRLTATGLVSRQADPSDARGTFTVLTGEGLDRLRAAAPTHLRGVGEYMSRLSTEELDLLGGLLAKLHGGESTGDCPPGIPGIPGIPGTAGIPGASAGDPLAVRTAPVVRAASTPATHRRP